MPVVLRVTPTKTILWEFGSAIALGKRSHFAAVSASLARIPELQHLCRHTLGNTLHVLQSELRPSCHDALGNTLFCFAGAVYTLGDDPVDLQENPSSAENCAGAGGGAISIGDPGEVTVRGAYFTRCKSNVGGAVSVTAVQNREREYESCVFNYNDATADGGAIYFVTAGGSDNVSSSVFRGTYSGEITETRDIVFFIAVDGQTGVSPCFLAGQTWAGVVVYDLYPRILTTLGQAMPGFLRLERHCLRQLRRGLRNVYTPEDRVFECPTTYRPPSSATLRHQQEPPVENTRTSFFHFTRAR